MATTPDVGPAFEDVHQQLAKLVSSGGGLNPLEAEAARQKLLEQLTRAIGGGVRLSRQRAIEFRDLWHAVETAPIGAQSQHEQDLQSLSTGKVGETSTSCATGPTPTGSELEVKAMSVPKAALHVDVFGEGRYDQALNVGICTTRSTTVPFGGPVPYFIYRKFSSKGPNELPFESGVADLVTSENGPIIFAGLAQEIARIAAPGGMIILVGPVDMADSHEEVAKAVNSTAVERIESGPEENRVRETRIQVPG